MKPCKHLDYTTEYVDCTIETCAPHFPNVKYWLRGKTWTDVPPGWTPNPSKVQFCGQGRGRINGVFQCYQPGDMSCYEPDKEGAE